MLCKRNGGAVSLLLSTFQLTRQSHLIIVTNFLNSLVFSLISPSLPSCSSLLCSWCLSHPLSLSFPTPFFLSVNNTTVNSMQRQVLWTELLTWPVALVECQSYLLGLSWRIIAHMYALEHHSRKGKKWDCWAQQGTVLWQWSHHYASFLLVSSFLFPFFEVGCGGVQWDNINCSHLLMAPNK